MLYEVITVPVGHITGKLNRELGWFGKIEIKVGPPVHSFLVSTRVKLRLLFQIEDITIVVITKRGKVLNEIITPVDVQVILLGITFSK